MSKLCEGRVVIVTGAGRGIGREHALEVRVGRGDDEREGHDARAGLLRLDPAPHAAHVSEQGRVKQLEQKR